MPATPCRNACPTPWRLFVSDLDGTLLDEQSRITPENLAAVARLASWGVGFTIATGRIDRMARSFVRQLGVTLPIIACNGAIIRDPATDRILDGRYLPPLAALTLIHEMKQQAMDFLCYSADTIYYPASSRRIALIRNSYYMQKDPPGDQVSVAPLEGEAETLARRGMAKVVVALHDSEDEERLKMILAQVPGLETVPSTDGVLEITASGATKGSALLRLAAILGLRPAEVIACGNHDNDAPMLVAAGLGIAVANASPAARAASHLVTAANWQSGVASVISHLFGPADQAPTTAGPCAN
jgi:hypothetical protein